AGLLLVLRSFSRNQAIMSDMDGKREIRRRILTLRNAMPREEITAASLEIVKKLTEMEEIRRASTLMVFLSFGSEVHTDDLIRWGWDAGKRIVVPLCFPETRELMPCRIDGFDELETGHYGIREPKASHLQPVPQREIDAVLIPAVAFDRRGCRVGYGGGYYDRFLPEVPRAAKIGAAFACQIVAEIPADPYDVTVDRIVTEKGIISLGISA
ncbi:MAG: 5-formyltetrahydrofolate cyclo-ligase, partial [Pseudomonadota bacterium]